MAQVLGFGRDTDTLATHQCGGKLWMAEIPRGRYIGKPADGIPTTEAEHFMQCPACGGWLDCRDLAKLLPMTDHCHTRRRTNRDEDGCAYWNFCLTPDMPHLTLKMGPTERPVSVSMFPVKAVSTIGWLAT